MWGEGERIDPAPQRKGQELETHSHPREEELQMFALTRLRWLVLLIFGPALAALLVFAAFTSAEAAQQTGAAPKEKTAAAG